MAAGELKKSKFREKRCFLHTHFYLILCVNSAFRLLLFQCVSDYNSATASISHRTPFGSSLTATQLLAGFDIKYFAYTELKTLK